MKQETFIVPEGVTEAELIETLEKVSKRIARNRKYIFDGHVEEDIVQRGIYEGLRCISRGKYEQARGRGTTPQESLERFMSVHIRKRLSNYKRDMLRKNNAGSQRGIVNPVSLTDLVIVGEDKDSAEEAIHKEMIGKIKSALSATPELLNDFHRMMDGSSLPTPRKIKLRERIVEILEDLQYGVQEKD